ncbi:MAG: hypothetical protein ACI35Q_08385 [Marinilabiliaceae bacterium]
MFETVQNWMALALAPLTGVITWWAARHKRKAEQAQLDNDTVNDLRKTIDDCVEQNKHLYDQIFELRVDYSQVKNECIELAFKNQQLANTIDTLKRANDELNQTIAALRDENEQLRKIISPCNTDSPSK